MVRITPPADYTCGIWEAVTVSTVLRQGPAQRAQQCAGALKFCRRWRLL
jgi:hypothetical protein